MQLEFARPWVDSRWGWAVFLSDPAVSSSIFVRAEREENLIRCCLTFFACQTSIPLNLHFSFQDPASFQSHSSTQFAQWRRMPSIPSPKSRATRVSWAAKRSWSLASTVRIRTPIMWQQSAVMMDSSILFSGYNALVCQLKKGFWKVSFAISYLITAHFHLRSSNRFVLTTPQVIASKLWYTVRLSAEERTFWGARLDAFIFRLSSHRVLISYTANFNGHEIRKTLMFLGQGWTVLVVSG